MGRDAQTGRWATIPQWQQSGPMEKPDKQNSMNFDASSLRETLSHFPTGVVVAATCGDGGAPVGLTISSFNSVSLEPPLILWSLALTAPSLSAFRAHDSFSINILSSEQQALCMQFAKPSEDKFSGVDWRPGHGGAPVIQNALAVLECQVYRRYEGGDHEIYVGEVIQIDSTDRKPLVFHRGQFVELADSAA